jgi:phenylalanyl-tRNA synthetase beta chain
MSLGFGCRWVPPDSYVVRVPYWRTDIVIPDDVAEELARIYGYNRLPSTSLRGVIPPVEPQPLRQLRERVRDLLAVAELQEVITYPLTDLETLGQTLSPQDLARTPPLRVANPMSRDLEYLRTTLRSSLLQAVARNLRHRRRVALFEVGRVYLYQPADLPQEREMASGAVAGRRPDRWGDPQGEPFDFYDAKGYVEQALRGLGIEGQFQDADEDAFLPGRAASIMVAGQQVGLVGQVHSKVAARFGIQEDVAFFELDVEALLPHVRPVRRYRAVPRYPSVERDLALVVEEDMASGRVKAIIEGSSLVARASLFDVYRGPPVPQGKKSLAFSISYQSGDHTLTDAEVDKEQRHIGKRLAGELAAVLRG